MVKLIFMPAALHSIMVTGTGKAMALSKPLTRVAMAAKEKRAVTILVFLSLMQQAPIVYLPLIWAAPEMNSHTAL